MTKMHWVFILLLTTGFMCGKTVAQTDPSHECVVNCTGALIVELNATDSSIFTRWPAFYDPALAEISARAKICVDKCPAGDFSDVSYDLLGQFVVIGSNATAYNGTIDCLGSKDTGNITDQCVAACANNNTELIANKDTVLQVGQAKNLTRQEVNQICKLMRCVIPCFVKDVTSECSQFYDFNFLLNTFGFKVALSVYWAKSSLPGEVPCRCKWFMKQEVPRPTKSGEGNGNGSPNEAPGFV